MTKCGKRNDRPWDLTTQISEACIDTREPSFIFFFSFGKPKIGIQDASASGVSSVVICNIPFPGMCFSFYIYLYHEW